MKKREKISCWAKSVSMSSVSETSVDTTEEHHVGADIRALRKARGIRLADMAATIDRSTGWLSQIERGHTEPGLADLRKIAQVFDMPVSFFFRNETVFEEDRGVVVRAGSRARLGSKVGGVREELLSPHLSGEFEMIRTAIEPEASSSWLEARPTNEGGYVVSGTLVLWIGQQRYELSEGDSFQFQNQKYRWENPGAEPVVLIWVVSPPVY